MRELINLVESAMHFQEDGIGTTTWHNEQVIITGGMRTGFGGPPGFARLKYIVLDTPIYMLANDFDAAKQGTVDLFIGVGHDIGGLIDITLMPKKRRAGIGAAVIRGLAETAGHDISIVDIQKKAVGFWKKMGCEFYNVRGEPANPAQFVFGNMPLMGVIRQGTRKEIMDLPGFRKPSNLKIGPRIDMMGDPEQPSDRA